MQQREYAVFLDLDVGKEEHHACGLEPKVQHPAVIELLTRFGGPQGIAKATRRELLTATKTQVPRSYEKFVDQLTKALSEQVVTVPGTCAAELVLPHLTTTLAAYAGLAPVTRRSLTRPIGTPSAS